MSINTITYSDKSDINVNSSVPSTNKVQAIDMNEIKNVVNNNANLMGDVSTLSTGSPNVVSSINTISKYSTTEQRIGTWIDEKPIYRKVVTFTNTSTNWEVIGTINNMNLVIGIRGTVYDGGNSITAIPSFGTDNVQIYVTSSGTINKKSTSYYQNKTGVLILEYTKTTD